VAGAPDSGARVSRPLRIAAIAAAAVLLTGLFVFLGFPWDRLADRIAGALEAATGQRVALASAGPHLSLLGPGIALEGLQATAPDGTTFEFERVRLRPAWSPSWLMLRPAVFVDAESPLGHVRGVTRLSAEPAFDGELRDLDLAALLEGRLPPGTTLTGTADVDAALAIGPEGVAGPVALHLRDGTLSHPELPMDVPYETLDAELELGGDVTARIVSFSLRSPLGTGSLTGTVGRAAQLAQAPLDLALDITASEQIRGGLSAQGVQLGRDGTLSLQVGGTLSAPAPRPR
jgi:type II secretion system protein N